jgi:hypothetical protein
MAIPVAAILEKILFEPGYTDLNRGYTRCDCK